MHLPSSSHLQGVKFSLLKLTYELILTKKQSKVPTPPSKIDLKTNVW